MESIFQAFAGSGYDWNEFHVYRHPANSRKFVVDYQGGCSCNSFEPMLEYAARAENPVGKREVYAEFSRWWNSVNEHNDTKIANMERLRSAL